MSADPLPDRFTIRWDRSARSHGGYRVSIPNYDGGEVVKAEAYDEAQDTIRLLRDELMRIDVACGNGSKPEDKLEFIRRVVRAALDEQLAGREDCGRLLVGQGTDTWDPTCGRPRGHEGVCRPGADGEFSPATRESQEDR